MALLIFLSDIVYAPKQSIKDFEINGIQLPKCPLCIERLDVSVSGLTALTSSDIIGCVYPLNAKGWAAAGEFCKVCKALSVSITANTLSCSCGVNESLWICLICGCLGCGRYQQGHASKHFSETNHTFSVDIESGRIWHYLGDLYVHRILKYPNVALIESNTETEEETPGNPSEMSVITYIY